MATMIVFSFDDLRRKYINEVNTNKSYNLVCKLSRIFFQHRCFVRVKVMIGFNEILLGLPTLEPHFLPCLCTDPTGLSFLPSDA